MRMSQLFSQTLREAPAEADGQAAGYQWLLRAGFIRSVGPGLFSLMPLGFRTAKKIETILREEMNAIGGQEMRLPVIQPAEVWQEAGRRHPPGAEVGRFKDRAGREMVLALAHEAVVADLARREIRSYRQLPLLIYHIQTKWRDDLRPRAGLMRTREFTTKDAYSLDADQEGLDQQYRSHYQAYYNIFNRCGLPAIAVKNDLGEQRAHAFMYLSPGGEDTLILCDCCGYLANRQTARLSKPAAKSEAPLPLEKVATPGVDTIKSLADFLNVPTAKTAKAVFMVATIPEGDHDVETFVFAVVRGDMEVNETKLAHAVRARELRPAREDEIRAVGASPGYASPVGLRADHMRIVVDDAIPASPNLVAGANEDGFHLLNTNYERDYTAHLVADIVAADAGSGCPNCGSPVRTARSVEVGRLVQLGTRYTGALGATFLDKDGQARPVIMGAYSLGVERLLACLAEAYNDNAGLLWPISVAPYHVHLLALPGGEAQAAQLYADLTAQGVEVLFDDRDERAGVKFNDADLIGLPLRVTVSERSLKNGGAELKRRRAKETTILPLPDVPAQLQSEVAALHAALQKRVAKVVYRE